MRTDLHPSSGHACQPTGRSLPSSLAPRVLHGRPVCLPDPQLSPDAARPPVPGGEPAPKDVRQVEEPEPLPGPGRRALSDRHPVGRCHRLVHQPQAEGLDAPPASCHARWVALGATGPGSSRDSAGPFSAREDVCCSSCGSLPFLSLGLPLRACGFR